MTALTHREILEADRERIRHLVDPVTVLADVANGRPLAVRDWEGAIIEHVQPSLDHRMTALKELLARTLPTLRSVDVTSEGDAGMTIHIASPIPIPGSQRDQAVAHIHNQVEDAVLADEEGDD